MQSLALHVFLFTTTGLCNSDTESHIYLLDPRLHDSSYSRGGCLGPELDTAPKRCSKHGSLSFDDFKQTAFTPSILSHLLFMLDLTLKSSFSTSTLWKFFLRKDCSINPFSSASCILTAALRLPACYKTSLFKCFLPFRK